MFKGGTVVTHKCIRTESSKTSTFDLQQTKFLESSSFSNRKHYYTTLPCENRGNREPNVIEMKQRFGSISWNTRSQSLQNTFQVLWMWRQICSLETAGTHQNRNFAQEEGNSQSSFVCIKAISSTTPVFCWKPDPCSQGTDALRQIWWNHFLYAFPPFYLILQVLKKVSYDPTGKCCLPHQLGSLKPGNPFC